MSDVFCPIDDAREWMIECVNAGIYVEDPEDLEELIAEMTDVEVKRWVNRNYAGGWDAFLDSALASHENALSQRAAKSLAAHVANAAPYAE